MDSFEASQEGYNDTLVTLEIKKELIEKINNSKFGTVSKEKPENDLVRIIPEIVENALSKVYTLESTCKTLSFQKTFFDKYEAQKEFANILYRHLSDNRWITFDKRTIKEIIDSGIFVDYNFKLELKEN